MANDIKQKIVLEGEQQYRNAIKDAQRNLKTLRSELKAETAELGANATAQEKNAAKIKSLQKQIKEQEKIVKANKDALEEVRQKYGDNADAIAKYEQKLNDSRTALANMKNELDSVGQGFKGVETSAAQATVATKSVADSLERLGGIGETISSTIESIFSNTLSAVKDMVTAAWQEVVNVAAKANNWTDTAAFLGSTASEVQQWDRAITAAQGDFGKLTSMITKLKYGGKEKTIAELFSVSDVNYTNDLKYTYDVLQQMVKQKDKMKQDGSWDGAMAAIFGKRMPAEVEWFLNNWDQIKTNLTTFDAETGGYGLTSQQLEEMNELYLKIGEIQQKWQALKESVTVGLFGKIAIDITTNANNILDAIQTYFNSENPEERQKALEEVKKNLLAMFTTAKEAIEEGIGLLNGVATELQNSDDPTAQTLGNVLHGIVTALEWFTEDNMNNVVRALGVLAAFWAVGKGASLAASVAAFVKDLKVIQSFKMIGSLGSLAGAGEAVGAAAGGSFLRSVAAGLPAVLIAALAAVPLIDMIKNPDKYFGETKEEKALGGMKPIDEAAEQALKHPEEAKQGLQKGLRELILGKKEEQLDPTNGNTFVITNGETVPTIRTPEGVVRVDTSGEGLNMTAAQWAAAQTFWDIDRERPGMFTDEEWDAFEQAFAGNEEVFDKLNDMMDYLKQDSENEEWRKMTDLPAEWWQTQGGNTGNTEGLTTQDAKTITQAVNSMPGAVAKGVSGIKVYLDGQTVGNLVAPYVSANIAAGVM